MAAKCRRLEVRFFMYLAVLNILLALLSIIGLAAVIGWVVAYFSEPREKIVCYTIIPVSGGSPDLEQVLRWGYNSLKWDRWLRGGRLVLLDLGANGTARELCERFCEDREEILLLTPGELEELLGPNDVYKSLRAVLY